MGSTSSTPPGTLPTDLWPLTAEQMLDFRLQSLRDLVAINAIQDVTVADGGAGYTDGTEIIVTPGNTDTTGDGAAGYIVVSDGVITAVKMTDLGALYTADPDVDVLGGSGASLTPVRSTVKLSGYNKATGQQYFSDADINTLVYTLVIDRRSELIAAYYDKLNEGKFDEQTPQDEASADAYARYEQIQIIYRWLRANCREIMLNDPGFQGSVPDHAREKFFKQWNTSITADQNWARQRSGGFASVRRSIR